MTLAQPDATKVLDVRFPRTPVSQAEGVLVPGALTNELKLRVRNGPAGTLEANTAIAVYRNGVLIWGREP